MLSSTIFLMLAIGAAVVQAQQNNNCAGLQQCVSDVQNSCSGGSGGFGPPPNGQRPMDMRAMTECVEQELESRGFDTSQNDEDDECNPHSLMQSCNIRPAFGGPPPSAGGRGGRFGGNTGGSTGTTGGGNGNGFPNFGRSTGSNGGGNGNGFPNFGRSTGSNGGGNGNGFPNFGRSTGSNGGGNGNGFPNFGNGPPQGFPDFSNGPPQGFPNFNGGSGSSAGGGSQGRPPFGRGPPRGPPAFMKGCMDVMREGESQPESTDSGPGCMHEQMRKCFESALPTNCQSQQTCDPTVADAIRTCKLSVAASSSGVSGGFQFGG